MSFLSSNKSKADKPKKEKKAKAPKEPKPKKEKKSKKRKKGEELSGEDGEVVFEEVQAPAPPKPVVPKRLDIYALILLISWILLVTAAVLAYLDLASYK